MNEKKCQKLQTNSVKCYGNYFNKKDLDSQTIEDVSYKLIKSMQKLKKITIKHCLNFDETKAENVSDKSTVVQNILEINKKLQKGFKITKKKMHQISYKLINT